ncbi:predicted protein, partial [Scheffersomyces stipitis CBS 6054]
MSMIPASSSQSEKRTSPHYTQDDQSTILPEKIYPPAYFEPTNEYLNKGWRFMFCNNNFNSDLRVFVSADSVGKYKSFKDASGAQAAKYARELQMQGVGIPLLKADIHRLSLNKFLTIKRYYVDKQKIKLRGFDSKQDLHDFCVVWKYRHGSYSTYELKFTPDPYDRKQDFTIVVFQHGVLPIADYVYNGSRYRWIHERRSYGYIYNYSNFLLCPTQDSMTDNWDKKTNRLEKSIDPNNPLVGGYLSKLLSIRSHFTKEEYYSPMKLGSLDEKRDFSILGRFKQKASFTMGDIYNTSNDPTVNYESIYS